MFSADGALNVSGDCEMVLMQPHHPRTVVLGFVDGHVERVSVSRLGNVR
jgi:prepilin-type processing-associated H-X9-DG protein